MPIDLNTIFAVTGRDATVILERGAKIRLLPYVSFQFEEKMCQCLFIIPNVGTGSVAGTNTLISIEFAVAPPFAGFAG